MKNNGKSVMRIAKDWQIPKEMIGGKFTLMNLFICRYFMSFFPFYTEKEQEAYDEHGK